MESRQSALNKTSLKGLSLRELEEFAVSAGEQKYRGRQLFDWMYVRRASSFDAITSISKSFRRKLDAIAAIDSIRLIEKSGSHADGTVKLLFGLADNTRIESVLIPPKIAFQDALAGREDEQTRLTLCISTQVGCPLDCAFCATGTMGLTRNLTAGEIVDQLIAAKEITGKRITNLVFMGMGEPLMNYDNVMKSLAIVTEGMKIAAKHITISTAGWTPGILRLAEDRPKVKLAVSLHSLDDATRQSLMPVARTFGLHDLLEALQQYYTSVKQPVTFEYILFDGVNDTRGDALKLVALSRRIPSKVNIIPYHDIAFAHPGKLSASLRPTHQIRARQFIGELREAGVLVFVRSSAGEDINAACGQLAVANAVGRPPRQRKPQALKTHHIRRAI